MSIRQTAKNFGVTKATVEYWLNRSKGKRLDRVDWSNKPINVKTANNRVKTCVEQCVLTLRKELKEQSPLGEFDADAIQREMEKLGRQKIPSRAIINRILKRNGILDGKHRRRFPPPPIGWYLTNVERKTAELDPFDYIEDLYIKGGQTFHVLNGISLHGGLVCSKPVTRMSSENTVQNILEHWREFGLHD